MAPKVKIEFVAGCPYEDYTGQILNLSVHLEKDQTISIGDTIAIEMMDGTYLEREVKLINPKLSGDYASISKKAAERVKNGEYGTSDKPTISVTGECTTDLIVMDVPYHEVKTEEEIRSREFARELQKMIFVTPYKELHLGKESIYDNIDPNFVAPDKVIAYLRTTEPYFMCPGIYDHPFKKGMRLLGPYTYTDGQYVWDRDTWKYVVKYHLKLPEKFIAHVMTDAGTEFINHCIDNNESWSKVIKEWKKKKGFLTLLPSNAGDHELKNF